MIQNQNDRKISVIENMRGGEGNVIIEGLVEKADLNEKGRLYARIILKPGCSIGYHVHEAETEYFYVIKGIADYDDNGTPVKLHPGDVALTPDGHGHSVANNGDEDVELVALILNK